MDRSWVGLFLFSIGSFDGHDNSTAMPHNAVVSTGSSFVTAEDSETSQTTEEDESWQDGERETKSNPPLPLHAQSLLLLVNATTGESDVDLVVDGRRYLLFSVGAPRLIHRLVFTVTFFTTFYQLYSCRIVDY